MKKGLILYLGVVLVFTLTAEARKTDPRTNLVTKEGETTVIKASGAKLPGVGTIVSTTGYGDAWRATAGMTGKSIIVDSTGTNIGIGFGKAASPCNLVFSYSNDFGANWGTQTIADSMNTRCYNGLALDNSGRPYIVWQDRNTNTIFWSRDEGGIGGGLWTPPDTLSSDSVAWYLPTMAIRDSILIISALAHAVAGGDYSTYYALSYDLGATWVYSGWDKFCDNEISGLGWDVDPVDWLISGSGDTVVAFLEVVGDTVSYVAESGYAGFFPAYKVSVDSGRTFGPMQMFNPYPQYWYGGWWYMYDGAWINDRPYFLFTWQDGTWNGQGLFVYFPTTAGDFSAWTVKRISGIPGNLAGVTPGDLNGGGVNFPTLSSDAAGNIYAIYNDYGKTTNNDEIFGVASVDSGKTWLNPVQLTNEA
ncbi:exo-alpha-sialidase, partial [candidate division TA06 bacterium]|nr:exo-alpha-sialidase [candidate division TA06 bacterium]